jgi:hypothetical protein
MIERLTHFSPDRRYRYTLWRDVNVFGYGYLQVIGLNPSTADEIKDDPTIRRCIGFARKWGFAELCMTNLFGFRATKPRDMLAEPEPIGADNNRRIMECANEARMILAAWGANTHPAVIAQAEAVCSMIGEMYCLRMTKGGCPEHPLYVPYDVEPAKYERPTP